MLCCEICGTKFKIIDNTYICEEGHTLKNKIEVTDDTYAMPVGTTLRPDFQKSILSRCSIQYMDLVFLHLLFEDVKMHLGIKSSKYMEVFANFFHEDEGTILSGPRICFSTLRALTYYSKRAEVEEAGGTYLYLEYCKAMEFYPYNEKFQEILDVLHLKRTEYRPFGTYTGEYGLLPVYRALRCLGEVGLELSMDKYNKFRYNETGVLDDELENNKACFRQDLKRDYKTFSEYLTRICDIFGLDITKDVEEKFAVFFYASNFSHTIHIPEIEISLFLYIYIMNYKRDFDVETATKRFKATFFGKVVEGNGEYCPGTFQDKVKSLVFGISWLRDSEFKAKFAEIKRLFRGCRDVECIREYRRKKQDSSKKNFIRAVWYIRKLMFQKRSGRI